MRRARRLAGDRLVSCICGLWQLNDQDFGTLVDTMQQKFQAGPLHLRVIEQPTSSSIDGRSRSSITVDLCADADGTPAAPRACSERAAKMAVEAELKKEREEERQAAEKSVAAKLKAEKAAAVSATLKRKRDAERQAGLRKVQALGSRVVVSAYHSLSCLYHPLSCLCTAYVPVSSSSSCAYGCACFRLRRCRTARRSGQLAGLKPPC